MSECQDERFPRDAGEEVSLDVTEVEGTPRIGPCGGTLSESKICGGTPKQIKFGDETPEKIKTFARCRWLVGVAVEA